VLCWVNKARLSDRSINGFCGENKMQRGRLSAHGGECTFDQGARLTLTANGKALLLFLGKNVLEHVKVKAFKLVAEVRKY
jgi:hypothetical protein